MCEYRAEKSALVMDVFRYTGGGSTMGIEKRFPHFFKI